jgi:hypothetical protein
MHRSQSRSFKYSLVITLPKAGVGRLLVSYTRLRIPITPRPVTWNLAFSEYPKALIYGGSSDANAHPALLLRRSLSDVWPVCDLRQGATVKSYFEDDSRIRLRQISEWDPSEAVSRRGFCGLTCYVGIQYS